MITEQRERGGETKNAGVILLLAQIVLHAKDVSLVAVVAAVLFLFSSNFYCHLFGSFFTVFLALREFSAPVTNNTVALTYKKE